MDSIEADGSSIDDAIARALNRLGVSRDRVEIEILANASRGLFGFGGKRARVRATLRRPVAFDSAPTAAAEAPAATPARPAPPIAANTPAPPVAPGAMPTARATARPPREPRRADQRPQRPRPPRQPHRTAPPPAAARVPREESPPDPAALERGRAVLAEIVRLSGVEASVETTAGGLRIVGDSGGLLIGRRGQTLDALEYFVNRAIGHEDGGASHLSVDANDYRDRRRQALEALARRMAERARTRGRPVSLEPMSPRDRRIVHLVLEGDASLTTRSTGSGFYRRLVIAPAGGRQSRQHEREPV